MKSRMLGKLGVWLCDRFYPRPDTHSEASQTQQYVGLMIDVLKGQVAYYGRDREENTEPLIAERRDYAKRYSGVRP